ncbi:30S ribosomal protein S21, partial [Bacteroides heparinolyticus]|uniref:30S ribosomal protein S21 n=1 Tax=Prevotella heparinolytica TaxID=28113 RepID=UPI0035A05BB1
VKEGENIEKSLKKFKRKFEKTGIVKELRRRRSVVGLYTNLKPAMSQLRGTK